MKKLYAIVLSNTANEQIRQMTENCLNSMHLTTDAWVKTCVVETNTNSDVYKPHHTIYPKEKFNYNRFVNYGFFAIPDDADYVGIFNNDLVFHSDWLDVAISKDNLWDSFSPVSPNWVHHKSVDKDTYGWGIGHQYCGWAIVMKKEFADKLFPLDEQFEFWCQDNDMAIQSEKLGMRHLLIHDSKVTHLFSKSHTLVDDMKHATEGMVKRFNEKYGE